MKITLSFGSALAIACLIWLGLPTSGPPARAAEASRARFTFSTSAEERVLTIRNWGGLSFGSYEYRLWGDGRFEKVIRKRRGGTVTSRREIFLEFMEVNELLDRLIQGDLMEWDDEEIAIRIRQAITGDPTIKTGGRLYAQDDAAWKEITINLESYQSRSGERRSPASVTFSYIWSPHLFRRIFRPGLKVPEVDALIFLQEQESNIFLREEKNRAGDPSSMGTSAGSTGR